MGSLDELWGVENLPHLILRSVAADVLFLDHLPRCTSSPIRQIMYSRTLRSRSSGQEPVSNLSYRDCFSSITHLFHYPRLLVDSLPVTTVPVDLKKALRTKEAPP